MPLTDDMQLISVDDHLIETPDIWQKRLPRRYLEDGPQVIEATGEEFDQYGFGQRVPKGAQVWKLEGRVYGQLGLNAVAGKPSEEIGTEPSRYEDMRPGCYEPAARVADMDADGVQAQLLFPSFPRFAGTMFNQVEDKVLALLCAQAWNDFVLEEWCGPYPDRFIPMIIVPQWDVEQSVAEIERLADRGIRAVSFPENPAKLGLPSFHSSHWDRLFSAIEAADLALCMHFGTSGQVTRTADDAPLVVSTTLMGTNSMAALIDLLFSPVFHRHPTLRVALSEGGVGWIPWALERADTTWERHRYYQNIDRTVRPSDLFTKHVWGCFIADQAGVDQRHAIGVGNMTWEGDYPHSDSFWPNSRKIVAEMFREVSDEETARIVELNARELYRFPRRDR
ncbi:amidohydrolase family protein [Frankia gtarii]|uniref:amidohydrolase family protein n=1 Tax=Frankia gtarii TaxID=2950102 RepID=UPI0021C07F89|nr:amidohydrolase family protein [Frankia gtarii]